MSHESYKLYSRRNFLKGMVVGGAAVAIGLPIVNSSSAVEPRKVELESNRSGLELYMPAWLSADEYGQIQGLRLQNVTRFILAFALPESDGSISLPSISSDLKKLLSDNRSRTKIGLSIGGWGDSNTQHATILKGWDAAINNPKTFVKSANHAIEKLGIDEIDLDIEFPTANQAGKPLTMLTRTLRNGISSDISIGMTVSPNLLSNPTIGDYRFGKNGLDVDTLHVMTYDENGGIGNQPAGYVATGQWAIECIDQWVKRIGDPSKISVGYPTYGYTYTGATKSGETYQNQSQVLYPNAPVSALKNNFRNLSTSGKIGEDGWGSFMSPSIIHDTQERILKAYPDIGGTFLWSAEGLIQADLDALSL